MNRWLSELDRYCKSEELIAVLVGNKLDLQAQRAVTTEEGRRLATESNMFFIETSAKDDINIGAAFCMLSEEIVGLHDRYNKPTVGSDEDDENAEQTRRRLRGRNGEKVVLHVHSSDTKTKFFGCSCG